MKDTTDEKRSFITLEKVDAEIVALADHLALRGLDVHQAYIVMHFMLGRIETEYGAPTIQALEVGPACEDSSCEVHHRGIAYDPMKYDA